jgi:plastocyanin
LALAVSLFAAPAFAEDTVQVTLKDHKFAPAEIEAPSGKAFTLEILNQDSTAAEFESKELRVEKVAPAGGKATVKVRALKTGRYPFFDDYHQDSAQGAVVVK